MPARPRTWVARPVTSTSSRLSVIPSTTSTNPCSNGAVGRSIPPRSDSTILTTGYSRSNSNRQCGLGLTLTAEVAGGVAGDLRPNVYYLPAQTPEQDLAIERERARGARFRGPTCELLEIAKKKGASAERKHDDHLRDTSPRKRASVRGGSTQTGEF